MIVRRGLFLHSLGRSKVLHLNTKKTLKCCYGVGRYKSDASKGEEEKISNGSTNMNEVKKEEEDNFSHFSKHKYVDFFRDETRNIGIITFKNLNNKKNMFFPFLEELRNVIEHINNILTNEESNTTYYIKDFKRGDNYFVRNIRGAIPYYDNKLKVLVISSVGSSGGGSGGTDERSNAFLDGIDFHAYLKGDEDNNVHMSNLFRLICSNIQNLPLITISSINGLCYNSGMDIILSTDFRISKEESRFGFDKTHIGLYPYGGSVQKLFRNIPVSYAKYLLLTGHTIDASDALKLNLVDVCINKNEDFYIKNGNVFFDKKLTSKEKLCIIKENVITYFHDIFTYNLLHMKRDDDAFVFTLFFAFQFLFIPTHILQNMKMAINDGVPLTDANAYLDCDRVTFEKTINSSQRVDILSYLRRKKANELSPQGENY
ncbi:enoyl-CoA hydratase, putative [Plasmodium ovale wallikeri]|uniref:Enoyl-CoA hydratase, putative n=2 Tax=Plasmodium ovale TaxID=36330 RepID=A0A1A8ZQ05_PLAOA|nr:enoyl-CoA hydratase, putative [Plasmodium ovale wallikeri]SBT45965.1 enoyl-CoA hydratase, putative [Plasmodium ovale wallikeri]SBT78831.1 enoyl-CoA hydratase, putative [Plasmodium ovale]